MENSEKKLCPYCNAEIDANAQKCKFCGEWVVDKDNEIPAEIKHFNWGAFLMNWIWGIMHKKYITLLYFPACIIPVIGPILISIWFGLEGNKWAWKSKNWESIEQFNEVQTNWVKLWIILAVVTIIILLKIFIVLTLIGNTSI